MRVFFGYVDLNLSILQLFPILTAVPTYCWQPTNATTVLVGVGDGSEPFVVSLSRSVSRYPSYLSQQCARFRINVNGSFSGKLEGYNTKIRYAIRACHISIPCEHLTLICTLTCSQCNCSPIICV